MTQERLSLGKKGEELAIAQLKALKYKILERNFKCPLGEIDIIARDKNTLVFVEVKTRATRDFGGPAAAVDWRKQRQLSKVALTYLNMKTRATRDFGGPAAAVDGRKQRQLSKVALTYLNQKKLSNVPARFDVVAVELISPFPRIEVIPNAFELCYE